MKTLLTFVILLSSLLQVFSQVHVKGYYRKNGTYVSPHTRSSPNKTVYDNYSYKGNVNPYTGAIGYKTYQYTNGKRVYRKVYSKKVTLPKNSYFYVTDGNKSTINSISSNKDVEILGVSDNNYYLIKYGGREGFIDKKFLSENDGIVNDSENDSTSAIYNPPIKIDTIVGKPAKIVVQNAILREYSESNDSNIIKTIPFGSEINVLYADNNDYWVVRHDDSVGVMLNVFFSYEKVKIESNKKKRSKFSDFINSILK